MATVADFINENKSTFDEFVRLGKMPVSVNRQFQIFKHYNSLSGKSKMQKYEQTAIETGADLWSVRNAIRSMSKSI